MFDSAFERNTHLIMGHYRIAAYLRAMVLAMANGTDWPIGLSYVAVLDDDHYEVCLDLLASYRKHGDKDPAFVDLVRKILDRLQRESPAERREAKLELWLQDVELRLRNAGLTHEAIQLEMDANFTWYGNLFDAGSTPMQAIEWGLQRTEPQCQAG